MKEREPAFPHPGGAGDFTVQKSHMGMPLRDYFAGQAMIALMSSDVWVKGMDKCASENGYEFKEALAAHAYLAANAMIVERAK